MGLGERLDLGDHVGMRLCEVKLFPHIVTEMIEQRRIVLASLLLARVAFLGLEVSFELAVAYGKDLLAVLAEHGVTRA